MSLFPDGAKTTGGVSLGEERRGVTGSSEALEETKHVRQVWLEGSESSLISADSKYPIPVP